MKKCARLTSVLFVFVTALAFANVTVTSPSHGSTVGTSVKFNATATSSTCSKGVASMGIYPAPYQLAYTVNGASLNTSLNFNPGTYNVVVQEWDKCGGASTSTLKTTGKSAGATGVSVSSPANNRSVGRSPTYVPTATTSSSLGPGSLGMSPAPSKLASGAG